MLKKRYQLALSLIVLLSFLYISEELTSYFKASPTPKARSVAQTYESEFISIFSLDEPERAKRMNALLDRIPKEERDKLLEDPMNMALYVETNLLEKTAESRVRVQEVLAGEDLYEVDNPVTIPTGSTTVSQADIFVFRLRAEGIAELEKMGLNLDKISPDILKWLSGGEYTAGKQALRDLFGERINRGANDYQVINGTSTDVPLEDVEKIESALKKVRRNKNLRECFGQFVSDKATPDTIQVCHESYRFFDKIFELQREEKTVGTQRTVFASSQCAIQINLTLTEGGSPFGKAKDLTTTVALRKKLDKKERESNFAPAKTVSFSDFYDFVSDTCPGYIALYRKEGFSENTAVARDLKKHSTFIYNIGFDKFKCWKAPRPNECILANNQPGRLDSIPSIHPTER